MKKKRVQPSGCQKEETLISGEDSPEESGNGMWTGSTLSMQSEGLPKRPKILKFDLCFNFDDQSGFDLVAERSRFLYEMLLDLQWLFPSWVKHVEVILERNTILPGDSSSALSVVADSLEGTLVSSGRRLSAEDVLTGFVEVRVHPSYWTLCDEKRAELITREVCNLLQQKTSLTISQLLQEKGLLEDDRILADTLAQEAIESDRSEILEALKRGGKDYE